MGLDPNTLRSAHMIYKQVNNHASMNNEIRIALV